MSDVSASSTRYYIAYGDQLVRLRNECRQLTTQLQTALQTCRQAVREAVDRDDPEAGLGAPVRQSFQSFDKTHQKMLTNVMASLESKDRRTEAFVQSRYQEQQETRQLFGGSRRGEAASDAPNEALLRERGSLLSSHRQMDELLGQAGATQDTLRSQRTSLAGAGSTLGQLASRFPAIQGLMGNIGRRQYRDNLVMGLVVGLCIVFMLWYILP